ncbi:hypothetical protein ACVWYI_004800 [Bradyrhizobium sp. LB13.1]
MIYTRDSMKTYLPLVVSALLGLTNVAQARSLDAIP